ncbi:TadE/TadG family type IV pilus assembly protein [Bacillus marasmi]|uniref:TadE/TadG family type IV pilus assembly protein n=1 Tax=Bacillus marasmi TaxID=1926279 RepID=UPI0011CB2728|nr:TadE/TadG family type IV pilus assembly protein [Bacillus marasmi]
MNRLIKEEKGAVMIIMALLMIVFLGITALVIDGGMLYMEKQKLQDITDAAALAGAQELPTSTDQATAQANQAIVLNETNPILFNINFNENNHRITVTAEKSIDLFFAKALGFNEAKVDAASNVEIGTLISGRGAVPVGIEYTSQIAFGDIKYLKVEDATVGNFGALALAGPGAKLYEEDFKNGYENELRVNQIIDTQTGNLAGPTSRAVNFRIAACPTSTYLNHPVDCPRIVLVPVFEPVVTQQNQVKQVKIVGFANFFIENVSSGSQSAVIVGRFIEAADSGEIDSGSLNFGAYGYKLTR